MITCIHQTAIKPTTSTQSTLPPTLPTTKHILSSENIPTTATSYSTTSAVLPTTPTSTSTKDSPLSSNQELSHNNLVSLVYPQ